MSEAWERLTDYASRHHGVLGLQAARRHMWSLEALRLGTSGQWWPRHPRPAGRRIGRLRHCGTSMGSHAAKSKCSLSTATSAAVEDGGVHETRRLAGVDLEEVDGIPCTAVPRTILDLAAVAHPFLVGQALDYACRRWPGMLDLVAHRFLELAGPGRRGTRLLRAMLDERLGRGRFTQSSFETMALELARSVGLPEPIPQFKVQDGDFKAYVDLAWPPPLMLGLECDSLAWHSGKRAHEWDRQRRRKLKTLGWDMIEVTYDDVTKRRAETGEELRALYHARVEQLRYVIDQGHMGSESMTNQDQSKTGGRFSK